MFLSLTVDSKTWCQPGQRRAPWPLMTCPIVQQVASGTGLFFRTLLLSPVLYLKTSLSSAGGMFCRYLQARVGFFCNLRPAAVQHLVTQVTLQTFAAGSVICYQGSSMGTALALISGTAQVFRKRERKAGHLRGGSSFGGDRNFSEAGTLLQDTACT